MLSANNISYLHPDRELLFNDLSISVNLNEKAALIGNNGSGKSTLLKILAGLLKPSSGIVTTASSVYYVPQHFGQYNGMSIAEALQIDQKINILNEILSGNTSEANMAILNDDWTIEERSFEALEKWGFSSFDLNRSMDSLSGGEKTKVFLAGINIHQPDIILMDEPTNHMDTPGRQILYDFIDSFSGGLLVVSHDYTLLNLLNPIFEFSESGIKLYGGSYQAYREHKSIEADALKAEFDNTRNELRKAVKVKNETLERKQRQDSRGKRKQEKAGMARIAMNTLRNKAESSATEMKETHAEKTEALSHKFTEIREKLKTNDKIKIDFNKSSLHHGKLIFAAENINFQYSESPLWKKPLTFNIYSGDRISIVGPNGSGKTTLIQIIQKNEPLTGVIKRIPVEYIYIDQDYSLIDNELTVFQQTQKYNNGNLEEHEVYLRLNRFLFTHEDGNRFCSTLSGGEKARLLLCCLMIMNHAPEMIILDEPTNNLDIQNIEILTNTIKDYNGTLLVVSHDAHFLQEIKLTSEILVQ